MDKLARVGARPAVRRRIGDSRAPFARARRLGALVCAVFPVAVVALAAPPTAPAGSAEEPKRAPDARPGSARAGAGAPARRPRARPAAGLWSLYPAGAARLETSRPRRSTRALPARPARPQSPDTRARPQDAAVSAKQPAAPGVEERPWLLGAGVGIGLGFGLLVLLLLLLAGLRTRPVARSPARRPDPSPRRDRGRPTAPSPSAAARPAAPPARAPAPPKPPPATPPRSAPPRAQPREAAPPSDATPASANGDGRAATHLVLFPAPSGYGLVQHDGEAPTPGTVLDGDELSVDGRFVVTRVGPSPLPLDPRRCAYLERSDA
jgi:hypothetical protein